MDIQPTDTIIDLARPPRGRRFDIALADHPMGHFDQTGSIANAPTLNCRLVLILN
jgi:hypothetical protein